MVLLGGNQELADVARNMSENIIIREYNGKGDSADVVIKTPADKEDIVFACIYGALITMHQLSDSLNKEIVDTIINTAETTLAAYDSNINCYMTLYKPLLDYYESLYNLGFLMCCIDSENYTEPTISFHDTFEDAKNAFIEAGLSDTAAFTKDEVISGLFCEKSCDNTFSISYKYNDEDFVSGTIIPVRLKNSDSVVIHYHAYDGVDFDICHTGSRQECSNYLESIKNISTPENELIIMNDQISMYNGNEYDVYTIRDLF